MLNDTEIQLLELFDRIDRLSEAYHPLVYERYGEYSLVDPSMNPLSDEAVLAYIHRAVVCGYVQCLNKAAQLTGAYQFQDLLEKKWGEFRFDDASELYCFMQDLKQFFSESDVNSDDIAHWIEQTVTQEWSEQTGKESCLYVLEEILLETLHESGEGFVSSDMIQQLKEPDQMTALIQDGKLQELFYNEKQEGMGDEYTLQDRSELYDDICDEAVYTWKRVLERFPEIKGGPGDNLMFLSAVSYHGGCCYGYRGDGSGGLMGTDVYYFPQLKLMQENELTVSPEHKMFMERLRRQYEKSTPYSESIRCIWQEGCSFIEHFHISGETDALSDMYSVVCPENVVKLLVTLLCLSWILRNGG